MRYSGRLTVPNDPGTSVPVVLEVDAGEITVTSNGEHLGTYPAAEARVSPLGGERFILGLGGEEVVFEPDDAAGFGESALSGLGEEAIEERPLVVLGGGGHPEPSPLPASDWTSPWVEPEGVREPARHLEPSPWEPAPQPAHAEWEAAPDTGPVAEPDDEGGEGGSSPAAGEPSAAALAKLLAESVIAVKEGSLQPERAHAMAALASAFAQVSSLEDRGEAAR